MYSINKDLTGFSNYSLSLCMSVLQNVIIVCLKTCRVLILVSSHSTTGDIKTKHTLWVSSHLIKDRRGRQGLLTPKKINKWEKIQMSLAWSFQDIGSLELDPQWSGAKIRSTEIKKLRLDSFSNTKGLLKLGVAIRWGSELWDKTLQIG